MSTRGRKRLRQSNVLVIDQATPSDTDSTMFKDCTDGVSVHIAMKSLLTKLLFTLDDGEYIINDATRSKKNSLCTILQMKQDTLEAILICSKLIVVKKSKYNTTLEFRRDRFDDFFREIGDKYFLSSHIFVLSSTYITGKRIYSVQVKYDSNELRDTQMEIRNQRWKDMKQVYRSYIRLATFKQAQEDSEASRSKRRRQCITNYAARTTNSDANSNLTC